MKSKVALLLIFALTAFTLQQNRKITGFVRDENQKPLADVIVMVPNTMISTTTDSLGRYTIQVPVYALTLTFVLPHYTSQQVSIGKSSTLNVTLKTGRINLSEALSDRQQVYGKVS